MSRSKFTIELEPSHYQKDVPEKFGIGRFTCPKCSGNGMLSHYHGIDIYMDCCPRCKGSGMLKACVIVEWSPDSGEEE